MKGLTLFLVLALLLLLAAVLVADEEKVSLRVYPKAVVASEFRPATIRASWTIYDHPDNRWWSFAYQATNGKAGSSGGSLGGNERNLGYTNTRAIEVYPGDYLFMACAHRVEKDKVKAYCKTERLEVRGGG